MEYLLSSPSFKILDRRLKKNSPRFLSSLCNWQLHNHLSYCIITLPLQREKWEGVQEWHQGCFFFLLFWFKPPPRAAFSHTHLQTGESYHHLVFTFGSLEVTLMEKSVQQPGFQKLDGRLQFFHDINGTREGMSKGNMHSGKRRIAL